MSQWETFILAYTRHKHLFRIDVHQATAPGGIEIFENRKINRRLSFETLQEIIEEMVQKGNTSVVIYMKKKNILIFTIKLGTAEWEGGNKGPRSEALIYWHTPDEWANLIWNWVRSAYIRKNLRINPSYMFYKK